MKNVVLLTVDCLRADHMSCYGYRRETTPFIDRLAKKSLFFKNAFSNGPNTRHSVPSFLSSTYPLLFLQEINGGKFHIGRRSVAEILKNNGYATAAVHSNPYISKFYGYDRGFDYFNDFLLGQVEDEIKESRLKKIFREVVKGLKAITLHKLPHEDGKRINYEGLRWLENVDEPFFLWLHYMDVHMPYVPPNQFLEEIGVKKYSHIKKVWMGKKIDDIKMRDKIKDEEIVDYINLYDGCVRYTDSLLKEIVSKIEKRYPDTIFIITADHGEEFREHGDLSHLEKLYDELLHIPLLFYGKGIDDRIIEKPVSLISLVPTILHLLGINDNRWLQGKNVFESEEFIIAEAWREKPITAYRDLEWKFIISGSERELYNITEDGQEKFNLYDSKDGKVKEKISLFEKIIRRHITNLDKERNARNTYLQKEKVRRFVRKMRS